MSRIQFPLREKINALINLVSQNIPLWPLHGLLWLLFFISFNSFGVIISYIIFSLFYIELIYRIALKPLSKYSFNLTQQIIFAIISALYCLFVVFYVQKEQTNIPFWDSVNYWKYTINFVGNNTNSGVALWKSLYSSIRSKEYNYFACFIVSPIIKIFGVNRIAYLLSVVVFGVIPFNYIILRLLYFLLAKIQKQRLFAYPLSFTLFTFILFFNFLIFKPLTGNYIGAVGLPLTAALFVVMANNEKLEFELKHAIGIGILYFLLFVVRRWFMFWIVSFIFVYGVSGLVKLWKSSCYNTRTLAFEWLSLFVSAATFLIILYLGFKPLFRKTFLVDYGDIYSAYSYGGPWVNFQLNARYIGAFIALISIGGAIYGLIYSKLRQLVLFILFQSLVIWVLFIRIQSFGWHHYQLFVVQFSMLMIFGALVSASVENKLIRYSAITFFTLFYGTNFLQIFLPSSLPPKFKASFNNVFSQVRRPPKTRKDIKVLTEFVEKADSLTKATKSSLYFIPNSYQVNGSIIKNIYFPQNQKSIERMVRSASVDLRDGYPEQLLQCRYIVASRPPQYHLAPKDQVLVGIPNRFLIDSNKFYENYKVIDTFTVDGDVDLILFEKINGFTIEEIKFLSQEIRKRYPDRPYVYRVPKLNAMVYDKRITDAYSNISFINNYTGMRVHPGDTSATTFKINTENLKEVYFNASFRNKKEIKKNCKRDCAEVVLKVSNNAKTIFEKPVSYHKDQPVLLDVSNYTYIKLSVEKGKNGSCCDWFVLQNFKCD